MGETRPSVFIQCLEILLTIVAFFLFVGIMLPGIALALIPIQLYRWTLIAYVKLFRRDIVRIMTGKNPVLAIDDVTGRPLNTIVGYGAFEGASVEHMVKITSNCVEECHPVTKQLLHPETHQYYEEWMGYLWWKWEKDWSLDKHVLVWGHGQNTDDPVMECDFMKIIAILEAKPFPPGQSPWQVVIVKNVLLKNVKNPEIPKIAIIYRFHHGLGDGVTALQLFMKCVLADSVDIIPQPQFIHRSALEKKLFKLMAFLQLPYQFLKQVCNLAHHFVGNETRICKL